ncbi:ribosomal-processing cysteine protease Prp [Ruminiclostridium josui]|uniref:ribosomal-processing cysteine protease Prp n=1 Tax=Ruminiclostridium josui TaxID=1499 RepID=UPI0004646676|nr:ribosomal-processing cysteine protease Prp [Ruminiclostridium josui]
MIKINIGKDAAGTIKTFVVKGHAGFAEEGSDIVCSAISAIAYTAVGAIEELIGLKSFFKQKHGFMSCKLDMELSPEKRHDANVIMATAEIGFKQIEFAYPDYVKVLDEEV